MTAIFLLTQLLSRKYLNERFLIVQGSISAERLWKPLWSRVKAKWLFCLCILCLFGWQCWSDFSVGPEEPTWAKLGWALPASSGEQRSGKKHHLTVVKGTIMAWRVFFWFLLSIPTESTSHTCHSLVVESSYDNLTWLLFLSFSPQIFSHLQKYELEISRCFPPPIAPAFREHFSKRNWWIKHRKKLLPFTSSWGFQQILTLPSVHSAIFFCIHQYYMILHSVQGNITLSGVGLDDPYGPIPIWDILWFYVFYWGKAQTNHLCSGSIVLFCLHIPALGNGEFW